MFTRVTIAFISFWLVATQGSGQIVRDMPAERIEEAIALGTRSKQLSAYKIQEKARWSWPPVIGSYTTPFMRVALAAHTAKKRYKPFTAADVTQEMTAPEIHVYAPSQSLEGAAIANVETVVVMPLNSTDPNRAMHPVRIVEATEQYKNLFGFTGEGRGILAVFPLDVWQEGNEIHVVFDKEIPSSHGRAARGGCTDCKSRIYLEKVR
jgi:hypothetical protein